MSNAKVSTRNKKSTEIVLSPQEKLSSMLNALTTKIAHIRENTNKPNLTSGQFSFSVDVDGNQLKPINIHQIMNVSKLTAILGFLATKKSEYEVGAKLLGLKKFQIFTWCGYDFEAWHNDIQTRVLILTNHEELTKLEATHKELSAFQSKDAQMFNLMAAAENLL
jgi:hypothetical protein